MSINRGLIFGSTLVCTTLGGASAFAQDQPQETGVALEEVVVTAERREENLQRTPIAISVVGGDQLIASGVSALRAIEAVAPDLNVRTDTLFTHFSIRGVGSFNNGELADAGVTIGIDNEYLNRPVALNASMMDIERIEVLRGPQGTLYGRNATAGAVNIITRKPESEFSGGLTVEGGTF